MESSAPVLLLVEDNPTLRSTLHHYLERRLPFTLVEAANAGDAVACAKRYRPSIILLDLSLPDAPGVAAISKLQSIGHKARLIAMVSHLECQHSEEAARAGAWACVPKEMLGSQLEPLLWRALPSDELSLGGRLNRWQAILRTGQLSQLYCTLLDVCAWVTREIEWLDRNGPWSGQPRTRVLYLANVLELVIVLAFRQHAVGI